MSQSSKAEKIKQEIPDEWLLNAYSPAQCLTMDGTINNINPIRTAARLLQTQRTTNDLTHYGSLSTDNENIDDCEICGNQKAVVVGSWTVNNRIYDYDPFCEVCAPSVEHIEQVTGETAPKGDKSYETKYGDLLPTYEDHILSNRGLELQPNRDSEDPRTEIIQSETGARDAVNYLLEEYGDMLDAVYTKGELLAMSNIDPQVNPIGAAVFDHLCIGNDDPVCIDDECEVCGIRPSVTYTYYSYNGKDTAGDLCEICATKLDSAPKEHRTEFKTRWGDIHDKYKDSIYDTLKLSR